MTDFMSAAIAIAKKAAEMGEVPVGAIVVFDGKIIASAHNLVENSCDPTAHAEILAIRAACQILQTPRLVGCDLFVTLEPCSMCATAISFARIHRLYFGAYDEKGGGVENGARIFSQKTCHHTPEIYGGIFENECAEMLKNFFVDKRN